MIRNRLADTALQDLLQTLLVAEVLVPSTRIWIVSPWITDVPLIDNSAGEFASLVPDWDFAHIRLSQLIAQWVSNSTEVFVVTRENSTAPNISFANLVRDLENRFPSNVHFRYAELVHEKGLLTDRFFLSGSFNYTVNGISVLDEVAHLFTDDETIANQHTAYKNIWSGEGEW